MYCTLTSEPEVDFLRVGPTEGNVRRRPCRMARISTTATFELEGKTE